MRKNKHTSDAYLINNYLKGDLNSFTKLVERWHQTFCRLAYWYVKDMDAAKDIAQESWTIIMKKIKTLEDPDKFKSWAISLINRKSIDWLRNKNREQRKLAKIYLEVNDSSECDEEQSKEKKKQILLNGIQQLSVKQQYLIRLFYIEHYSLNEIAVILDISVGTAKSRLFYTREKLKSLIKNKDHEK
jgi:RNA polymerase sigma-70 factor (ECF subfamily)